MKKIITESQLRNIIKETVRRLLTEDKVSDYIKKQIANNSRYSKEMLSTPVAELPKDVRSSMQESAPSIYNACVNHGQNLSAFLRLYFLSYFDINHGKGPVEYVMGLARIAIGELKMFDSNAESDTALLKQVVLFLHNSTDEQLKAQYDGNLNGLDFYALVNQLNGARREFNAANRTRLKGATDGRVSAYKVVAINSAEEAAKYGQFTSWCVTHSKANYDRYTEGGRRFYFCLRDGFEDVPKRAGEGCPLDDYGLSMISVLVDPEGEPNVVTTRWNHENDGENNENLHTAEQVQEVTNINFYATFKPYSLEQLTAMGITPFYAVQDMLDKGAKPEDIFVKIDEEEYGLRRVYLNRKYNFIDDENKLLFDRWFDSAGYFYEGFAAVQLNNKWNFINTEGQLLSNQWFDNVRIFNEGFAVVGLNDKRNFINTEGQIAFDQWFDDAERFYEGFAAVQLNNKCNYINTEGQLLSNQWFDGVWDFSEGFAGIRLNGKWNYINTEGQIAFDQWFDSVWPFSEGFAQVYLNGKYNFINTEGQIAFNQWFDGVWDFSEGVAEVILNGKRYNLDKEGNLTLKESRRIISPTITESQLRNIIKETVRRVLNEGKDANQLADAFVRKNPNLNKEGLVKLLMADPTASQNDRGSFAGKYGVWIGNMYANGGIKPGDAPELKSALFTYDKNKTQLPPIKDCKSLSELIEWVKDLSDDFKAVRNQSKAKADLEKVYEDDEWVVYVPHSHAAARRGGEGTHWCTASENDYYYNMYSKQGPLYINIRKSDGAKFQFHFESDQFMDADDNPIKLNKIGLSEGLISFYSKIGPMPKFKFKFDDVRDFYEGFAVAILNGKYNFINTEGQLLSNQWFDWADIFKEGLASVRLNGKRNFINTEGQILSKQWFDWEDAFNEGFASVRLNGKWNFINTKGQFLSKQWFDCVKDFYEGVAAVMLNGQWNFINREGQVAFKQWFDWVWSFNRGFAVVQLNGKWNFINTKGQLLSNLWFDDVGNFNEGFAAVKLNGRCNFINTEGQLLSQQWFDDVRDFYGEVTEVILNGKWYNLDKDGNLTLAESRSPSSPVITESQLRNIIKETVRRVLNEGKDANQLADAFVRKNPNIDKNGLIKLLMADPTASQNDRGSFAGRYGVWIGNMYANGGIKPGDIPELKSALITYDKNKTQLPPIKDCRSLSELIEWVKDLSDDFKPVRKQSKAKADLEKVYEDDEWVVYVPHSHAAARRGGEGTHWCTASENDYYYNRYSKDGPLYINIRKSDGAKFQFHFESNQFMNADDDPVSLKEIGLSEGIIDFYNQINPIFDAMLKCDFVDSFNEGLARVKLNSKQNFINTEGQILSKQWFDWADVFREGFASVRLNGKWNFINTKGQFLSKQWFDWVADFNEGFAEIKLNGKWNFINTDGQLLSNQWFDSAGVFMEGFAQVKLNGKWNFINREGQIAFKQWFDIAWSFDEGFAKVELNGKWYNLDKEGNLTLAESRSPSSPVITESILKRIKSECIKRLIAIK